MVPDIEWGKNIRLVLDIWCSDSSFVGSLLEKDVLTLSLGLKNDLVDLAQVALERGFPTIVSPFSNRRLPFPTAIFDTIHCGACRIPWHARGLYLSIIIFCFVSRFSKIHANSCFTVRGKASSRDE